MPTASATSAEGGGGGGGEAALRIDRWLWCTRFFKTRSLAAEAVKGGHVKLNGQRVKPSREVRVGDALSIARGLAEMDVTVTGVPERRGPAPEAARCYEETEASRERRRLRAERRAIERAVATVPTPGRPDKRTRRLLRERRLKQGEDPES